MYKIEYFLMLILVLSSPVYSQEIQSDFGKVAKTELEMTKYYADENAGALVLFDLGKSYFERTDEGFKVVFERHTRIKIFSEAGIKWAKFEIPYYQQSNIYEEVSKIEATTYNLQDGVIRKTSLSLANSYDEKINESWIVKKFAMPDARAGSVVECRYKIESQIKFNLRDWEFQWEIPVAYSEYEVKMIPFYSYSWLLQGANKFDYQTSYEDQGLDQVFGSVKYKNMIHKYVMKNLPAFNDEEFISTKNDYIIKLDFQLSKVTQPNGSFVEYLTTWNKMIKDLLGEKEFQGYVKKSGDAANKLMNIESLSGKTSREKFDYVIDYMKINYKWNESNSIFASKSPSEFVRDKYGNSADINLFAIGALNKAGIESYPVIISTREHGKIKYDYPFFHFFNYVLILSKIDGKNVLTDATEILNLNDRIPPRCINDKGLVIRNSDKPEWVGLECLFLSEISSRFELTLSDSSLNGSISKSYDEYDAFYSRDTYGDNTNEILKDLDNEFFEITDTSVKIENYADRGKPYLLTYEVQSTPEKVLDKIYLHPFLYETVADNPLKQKTRTYPIDFVYPRKRIYKSVITIPDGYDISILPSAENMKSELVDLTYSAVRNDNNTVEVDLEYCFKKSVYSAGDYQKIKTYYNFIVKKGNEKIVFAKKSGS